MSKQTVLLVGATGETGASILKGLLDDGDFDVSIFVQPSSAHKRSVQALQDQGLRTVIGNLQGPVEELVPLLSKIDILISAVGPGAQLAQLPLIDAAKLAGVKRFVPCGFTIICPPGGVMILRDDKEIVYNHMFKAHLPYTIIDVGFWHQISFPRLPSGRSDYAALIPNQEIYGDGNAPNLLTDERDIGAFVARIIKDERTLNKKVFTHSDALSQHQIWEIMERLSGEKIPATYISENDVSKSLEKAQAAYSADKENPMNARMMYVVQYNYSKYIRCDNTPKNAKYLGYLDARELYPDLNPITFEQFIEELLDGKARKPYPDMKM